MNMQDAINLNYVRRIRDMREAGIDEIKINLMSETATDADITVIPTIRTQDKKVREFVQRRTIFFRADVSDIGAADEHMHTETRLGFMAIEDDVQNALGMDAAWEYNELKYHHGEVILSARGSVTFRNYPDRHSGYVETVRDLTQYLEVPTYRGEERWYQVKNLLVNYPGPECDSMFEVLLKGTYLAFDKSWDWRRADGRAMGTDEYRALRSAKVLERFERSSSLKAHDLDLHDDESRRKFYEQQDMYGNTRLMVAASQGIITDSNVINVINAISDAIRLGADLNIRNKAGNTFLSFLANKGDRVSSVIAHLYEMNDSLPQDRKIDFLHKNDAGESALDIARRLGHANIFELLNGIQLKETFERSAPAASTATHKMRF
jgi:hypothetical protein